MFHRGRRDPRGHFGKCRAHGMPMLPSAANAVSATDAKRLCHDDQGDQIMKKLATLTAVIALATAFAAGAEAAVIKVMADAFFGPCVSDGGVVTVSSNTEVTGAVDIGTGAVIAVTITKDCTVDILKDARLTLNNVILDDGVGPFDLVFDAGSRTVLTIRNGSDLDVGGKLTIGSGARSRLDISGSTLLGDPIDLSAGGGFSRINIAASTLTSDSDLVIAASPSGGNNGGRTVVEDSDLTSAVGSVIEVSASFLANSGIVSVSGGVLDGGTAVGGIKIRAGFKSKTTVKFVTFKQGGNLATPANVAEGDIVIEGTNCKSIGNTPTVDCS